MRTLASEPLGDGPKHLKELCAFNLHLGLNSPACLPVILPFQRIAYQGFLFQPCGGALFERINPKQCCQEPVTFAMFEKASFWRMIIDSFSHFRSLLWCCLLLALVSHPQLCSWLLDTAVHPQRTQHSSKWLSPWACPQEQSLLLWMVHYTEELLLASPVLLKTCRSIHQWTQLMIPCEGSRRRKQQFSKMAVSLWDFSLWNVVFQVADGRLGRWG